MPLGANKVALYGASADTGSAVLLSTATVSDGASIEFTLPTTYKQVKFGIYNIGTTVDGPDFQFSASTDSASSYGVTKTTTTFRAEHKENDTVAGLAYETGWDEAQSTDPQLISWGLAQDADAIAVGELQIFVPQSTTYVKHFIARLQSYAYESRSLDQYTAGYFNTTSALTNVKFYMTSGNIEHGTIKMWGIK